MTMITPAIQAENINPNSNQSPEVKSLNSERSILRGRASSIEDRRDWWKSWYSGLAIAAILSAGLLGLLSWGADRLSSINEAKAKPLISRIGEIEARLREIDKEQLSKDVAEANRLTAEANKTAGEANNSAAEANKHAADLDAQTEVLRQRNLVTEDRLLDANMKIGVEEDKRHELEKSLLPRLPPDIENIHGKTFQSNFDTLRQFPGVKAIIEFIPDAECRRLARRIAIILRLSKWIVDEPIASKIDVLDGVHVFRYAAPKDPTEDEWDAERVTPSAKASVALVGFLLDCGVQANEAISPRWPQAGNTDPVPDSNSVRILIGLKPDPYFDSEGWKKVINQMNESAKISANASGVKNLPCKMPEFPK